MKTLSAPRRMKSMPRGRPSLSKEVRGTSARGQFTLRVLHPSRKRSVPLAAPRPVDTQEHAWAKRPWSRGALASRPRLPLKAGETPQARTPSSLVR